MCTRNKREIKRESKKKLTLSSSYLPLNRTYWNHYIIFLYYVMKREKMMNKIFCSFLYWRRKKKGKQGRLVKKLCRAGIVSRKKSRTFTRTPYNINTYIYVCIGGYPILCSWPVLLLSYLSVPSFYLVLFVSFGLIRTAGFVREVYPSNDCHSY